MRMLEINYPGSCRRGVAEGPEGVDVCSAVAP